MIAMRPTIREGALVALDQITTGGGDFAFRTEGLNEGHKADLAGTIRNTGKALDPVLLWQPPDASKDAKLVLLDGLHRIMAYRAVGWTDGIPALILVGADRRAALGAALKASGKRVLGLTQSERLDAAWRLVREPVTPRFKVNEIATLADVAGRTVDNMRARFRVMLEEEIEITGYWWRDRRSRDSEEVGAAMTDTQRRAEIEKLAADIRDLLDRRKHPERAVLRESEAVWEAIQVALGERTMKDMLAWLHGGDEAGADEWLLAAATGRNDVAKDAGEDGEEEPAF